MLAYFEIGTASIYTLTLKKSAKHQYLSSMLWMVNASSFANVSDSYKAATPKSGAHFPTCLVQPMERETGMLPQ